MTTLKPVSLARSAPITSVALSVVPCGAPMTRPARPLWTVTVPCPGRVGRALSATDTVCLPPRSPAQPDSSMARPSAKLGRSRPGIRRVPDEERLRHGVVTIVREREQDARGALGAGDSLGAAREDHDGRLAALAADLELAPVDPHAQNRAEGLERRLLGREAGDGIAATPTVGDLRLGEDTAQEALVPALDGAAQARDLGQIDPHSFNHRPGLP